MTWVEAINCNKLLVVVGLRNKDVIIRSPWRLNVKSKNSTEDSEILEVRKMFHFSRPWKSLGHGFKPQGLFPCGECNICQYIKPSKKNFLSTEWKHLPSEEFCQLQNQMCYLWIDLSLFPAIHRPNDTTVEITDSKTHLDNFIGRTGPQSGQKAYTNRGTFFKLP